MSAYPRHVGVEEAMLEAHALEQTPFFGALARQYGEGKARELTLAATAGRWNAENNGHAHDEAKARLFVHNALLSAGVSDGEAATISQSFPLSAFDRTQIASNGGAASLGHITAQAAGKAEEQKAHRKYNDLTALMAGTASDNPDKIKGFFIRDALGRTRLDIQTGGTGYQRGEAGNSSNAYSNLDATKWSPASGGAGLTERNFPSTRFPGAGVDLGTAKELLGKGYNENQIVNGGHDAKHFGFAKDKEAIKDFTALDNFDHEGRKERNRSFDSYARWLTQHKDELQKLQEQAKTDPVKQK